MSIDTSEMVDVPMVENCLIDEFICDGMDREYDDEIIELLLGEE